MKKIIFDVKAGLLMCGLFLVSALSANAQTLTFGSTNALGVSVSSSGSSPVIYTYNVTIPYFANELTGTFTVTQGTSSVPFTCGAGYFKSLNVSNAFGYVNSSNNVNTVTIPGVMPVGINSYTIDAYCATGGGLPSQHIANYNIKIIVTRETAPAVSLNFAPYCKTIDGTNPPQYNGYIGFNVSGSYTNGSKLYLRVSNLLNTCGLDEKLTNFALGAASATISPATSFYDCAAVTTYTIQLIYKTTSISGMAITNIVNSGELGWTDYSWRKRIATCLNTEEPQKLKLRGKVADELMLATEEIKKYNVYPNPTNSDLNIVPAEGKEIRNAKVIDPSGFVYESRAFRSAKDGQTISLGHLRPGIYFVEIETNEGVFVEKVVKN